MRRALNMLFALSLAVGTWGCGTPDKFAFPKFFSPGPTDLQRQRAQKFDPYAEYGPALSESRPRSYDTPPPEAARDRWGAWGQARYGYP